MENNNCHPDRIDFVSDADRVNSKLTVTISNCKKSYSKANGIKTMTFQANKVGCVAECVAGC